MAMDRSVSERMLAVMQGVQDSGPGRGRAGASDDTSSTPPSADPAQPTKAVMDLRTRRAQRGVPGPDKQTLDKLPGLPQAPDPVTSAYSNFFAGLGGGAAQGGGGVPGS